MGGRCEKSTFHVRVLGSHCPTDDIVEHATACARQRASQYHHPCSRSGSSGHASWPTNHPKHKTVLRSASTQPFPFLRRLAAAVQPRRSVLGPSQTFSQRAATGWNNTVPKQNSTTVPPTEHTVTTFAMPKLIGLTGNGTMLGTLKMAATMFVGVKSCRISNDSFRQSDAQ